jgi:hypothetical protein
MSAAYEVDCQAGPRRQLGASGGAPTAESSGLASAPYDYSPADVLRYLIVLLGYGVLPDPLASSQESLWPTYCSAEPTTPDDVVTTYDTTPRQDGRDMIDGQQWYHYGVQVRVRAVSQLAASAKAQAITRALLEDVNHALVTINSSSYCVNSVSLASGPLFMGHEGESKRPLYTVNLLVSLRRLDP